MPSTDELIASFQKRIRPFEVTTEEREQVMTEGEVGLYPGDNPDQFLQSGRNEFDTLKTDRLALTDQVKRAREEQARLHPHPRLERMFEAVTGSVPSFLSPDVPTPEAVLQAQPQTQPSPTANVTPGVQSASRQVAPPEAQPKSYTLTGQLPDISSISPKDQKPLIFTDKAGKVTRTVEPKTPKPKPSSLDTLAESAFQEGRNIGQEYANEEAYPVDIEVPEVVVTGERIAQPEYKPASIQEALTNAVNNYFQGAAGVTSGALKSVALASRELDRILPDALKDPRKAEDRFTYKLGTSIENMAKRLFPSDPASQQDFMVGVLPQALGSMTGFMAGGLAGTLAKAPGTAAAVLGAGVQGAEQYEEAKHFKADDETQRKAFLLGSAIGTTEGLPIAAIFKRFNTATGGVFFRTLKESGVTAAQEFVQEWGQAVGSNAVAGKLLSYDDTRGLFDNAGISGSAGGATGAIVGLLSGLLQGRRIRRSMRNQEQATDSQFTGEPEPAPSVPPQPPPQPAVPTPQELVAGIPNELQVAQGEPFLVKQPRPETVAPAQPEPMAQAPVEPMTTQSPSPMPLLPAPPVETMPAVPAQPERALAPEPEAAPPPVIPGDTITPDMREALDAPIDVDVHEAATSPVNPLPEPTDAMKKAGNYKKGHVRIAGLDISIENPQGSIRSGTDKDGKPWSQEMQSHYGYIRDTKGKDKDHIDVFIKPGTPKSYDGDVYIIDQNRPGTKTFDEHKVILGASSQEEAEQLYLENYASGWTGLGAINKQPMHGFKQWLKSGETTKPFNRKENVQREQAAQSPAGELLQAKNGKWQIRRPDGTFLVNPSNGTTEFKSAKKAQELYDKTLDVSPIQDEPQRPSVETPEQAIENPVTQQPRSELPIEQNMDMMLRAEKAEADLEIAGKETGRRKVFDYDVQGQGGTPEVTGLRSAAPAWYTELTTGPRPLKRAQIDTAIQKIIKDEGSDVGTAVERVKEALLRDREFNKTPWGEDADAIMRGEWPSWIEKPGSVEEPTAGQAQKEEPPTQDLVLTAPQSQTVDQKKANSKSQSTQMSIAVPPPVVGERPIIGREVTPEEAPLFSKAAQVPTPEQTTIKPEPEEVKAKPPGKPVEAKQKTEAPKPAPGASTKPVTAKQAAKPSAYALDTIDRMYRTILDDTKVVHHMRRGNKEAWATVKRIDTAMKQGQSSGLDYDEAAAKVSLDDLDALNTILEEQKAKPAEKIEELGAPDRTATKAEAPRERTPATELADLFKQETEHSRKKKAPSRPRIPVDPIMGGKPTALNDILLDLQKGVGKKLTTGKTKARQAGVYKPGSAATVVRYSGDLDTTAHEVSHALDDQYGLVKDWSGQDTSPFDTELEPFSEHGSVTSTTSPTYNRAEGVAEYLRAWLVNPAAAEAAAPTFAKHVKAKLPTDIQKALKTFSDQVRSWAGNSAHAKIMANVQWEAPETGLTDWLTNRKTSQGPGFQLTFGDQLAVEWTDTLAPFMKALKYARGQRGGQTTEQAQHYEGYIEDLTRLYMGENAKIDDVFAHGMIDSKMDRATPGGLPWLIEPLDSTSSKTLEADMQEVASLMIAQRTLEKAEQLGRSKVSGIGAGIEADMTVAEARLAELKKNPERYAKLQEAASRYRQWADANLRYLVEKGRLSQEDYEGIKARNEYYVAMQRMIEVSPGEELQLAVPRGTGGGKIGSVKQPVQAFKGSTKAIKNPYHNLMDATNSALREADRNEIMKLFRDMLTNDRGLYEGQPTDLASVGRTAQAGEKHTIPIYVNGKKEIWQFHPDVYAALKDMQGDHFKFHPLIRVLPQVLRSTIVNAPPFALRNLIRDSWHRAIVSLSGSKPWDTLKPYSKEEISKLKRSGGDQAGHYYSDPQSYARAMKYAMQEAVNSNRSIVVSPSKLAAWVAKGGRGYLDLMQQSERQGRLSEYRRAFEKAKKKLGYDDYHASIYAAAQSRSLIDYAIAGRQMRWINQVVPFSNAAVQGLRANLLRAKADPTGYAMRFGAFALVPTLATYLWNYALDDDMDEYRQLPAYQRDLFWNFKLGPDLWLKIPKPFENGVAASSFERGLDYAMGNNKAFDGHTGAFLRTLLPIDEASFMGPFQAFGQAMANYDFFRDRHIVPQWEENIDLELRSYNRASRLGQALQHAIGVDARKIDFMINQQFGYLGRYAADISDIGRKDRHGLTISASGVTGASPSSVSIDAKKVMEIAESRGVVAGRSKRVDRVKDIRSIPPGTSKNIDSARYAIFKRHLNEVYKAETREDRDRLAAIVRSDAKYLRELWEKNPPRQEATKKAKKKREEVKDPLLEAMGFFSDSSNSVLHESMP